MNSFYHLMEEKPFEKITIEEIAENAYLTRATFYHYFLDKHDLLNSYYKIILEKTIYRIGEDYTWEEANLARFCELKSKKVFFTHAFEVEDTNSIFSEEYKASKEIYKNLEESAVKAPLTEEQHFVINFFCLGSMKTTTQWINRDMAESSETMTAYLKAAMPLSLRLLLHVDEVPR